uniref:TATA box-binding protein-associated factor RNA polymerase I subunit D n=1 Tax=Myotis lucifugus TaxID=59463 RepID=G1PWC5_MYOLU
SDISSSGRSLFKTQCVPSPKWRQRNPSRICVSSLESAQARDSSSDSSLEPRPLTLKATIFERFKKKKCKKRKYEPTGRPGRTKGRKNTKPQINKKQFKDKTSLPLLESDTGRKPLLWRKSLTFEPTVARGFFNYLEKLKYEYHLKGSSKQMNAGEDLEEKDPDSHRYKHLDDSESISPTEESAEDEVATNLESGDECDVKLVENNYFIVSSELPKNFTSFLESQREREGGREKKREGKKSRNSDFHSSKE